MEFGNDFSHVKTTGNKRKKQTSRSPSKNLKFVHQRHYQQIKNLAHRMKENICKSYTWQGTSIHNVYGTPTTQQKQQKNSIKKGQST